MIIIIVFSMPSIYLKKNLYDTLVQREIDVTDFVNEVVEKKLKEEKQIE